MDTQYMSDGGAMEWSADCVLAFLLMYFVLHLFDVIF
jgi:hypothetical protein